MKRFPIILLAAVCLAVFSGPAVAQVGNRRSMGNLLPSNPTAARAIQGSYRLPLPNYRAMAARATRMAQQRAEAQKAAAKAAAERAAYQESRWRRSMGNLHPGDPTAARAIQGSYRFTAPPRVVMPYVAPPVEYRRPPYRLEPTGVPGPQTDWQFHRRFKWFYDPYEDRFYAYAPQTGLFHAVVPNY